MLKVNKQILYSGATHEFRGEACVGSDGWCAVADLHVELVRRLGQWRPLQHVVLHDRLLISIDGGVRVVRVIP